MYAAVDLGSNSFHLLIAHFEHQGFTVVERYSETVQLGHQLGATGRLSDDAIRRGIACLAHFKGSLSRHPITAMRCCGTNALRVAQNRQSFLDAASELGFEIDVVSGEREAELIYRGVTSRLPPTQDERLVFDIGGGSTEFAAGRGGQPEQLFSTNIGCVSWRDTFFPAGEIKPKLLNAATELAIERLLTVKQAFAARTFAEIYAASGTAKMLCAIAKEMGQPAGILNRKGLKKIRKQVLRASAVKQLQMPGLKPQRQDLLVPGLTIMNASMEALDVDEMAFSPTAMREGILQEMLLAGASAARA